MKDMTKNKHSHHDEQENTTVDKNTRTTKVPVPTKRGLPPTGKVPSKDANNKGGKKKAKGGKGKDEIDDELKRFVIGGKKNVGERTMMDSFENFLGGFCPKTPNPASKAVSAANRNDVVDAVIDVLDDDNDFDYETDYSDSDDDGSLYQSDSSDDDDDFISKYNRRMKRNSSASVASSDASSVPSEGGEVGGGSGGNTLDAILTKKVDPRKSRKGATDDLASDFRRNVNVKTRTNKLNLKKYKKCFVASSAVTWLVESGNARTRIDAVKLGQELQGRGLFMHVTNKHVFNDSKKLFFRFLNESEFVSLGDVSGRDGGRPHSSTAGSSAESSMVGTGSEYNSTTTNQPRRKKKKPAKSLSPCRRPSATKQDGSSAAVSTKNDTDDHENRSEEENEKNNNNNNPEDKETDEHFISLKTDDEVTTTKDATTSSRGRQQKGKDELARSEHSCVRPKFQRQHLYGTAHRARSRSSSADQHDERLPAVRESSRRPRSNSADQFDKDNNERPAARGERRPRSSSADQFDKDAQERRRRRSSSADPDREERMAAARERRRRLSSSPDPDKEERMAATAAAAASGRSRRRSSSADPYKDSRTAAHGGGDNRRRRPSSDPDKEERIRGGGGGSSRRRSSSADPYKEERTAARGDDDGGGGGSSRRRSSSADPYHEERTATRGSGGRRTRSSSVDPHKEERDEDCQGGDVRKSPSKTQRRGNRSHNEEDSDQQQQEQQRPDQHHPPESPKADDDDADSNDGRYCEIRFHTSQGLACNVEELTIGGLGAEEVVPMMGIDDDDSVDKKERRQRDPGNEKQSSSGGGGRSSRRRSHSIGDGETTGRDRSCSASSGGGSSRSHEGPVKRSSSDGDVKSLRSHRSSGSSSGGGGSSSSSSRRHRSHSRGREEDEENSAAAPSRERRRGGRKSSSSGDSLSASMHCTGSRRSSSHSCKDSSKDGVVRTSRHGLKRQMSQPMLDDRPSARKGKSLFDTKKEDTKNDTFNSNRVDDCQVKSNGDKEGSSVPPRPSSINKLSLTGERRRRNGACGADSLGATVHGGSLPSNSREGGSTNSFPPRRPTLVRQMSQPAMTMEGMYIAKPQTNPRIPLGKCKPSSSPTKAGASSDNIDFLLKDLRRESKRNTFAKVNNSTPAPSSSKDVSAGADDSDDDSVVIVLKTK